MDMENEMLNEGAAGEIVTPETEVEDPSTLAEAEGEKGNGTAERSTGKETQSHEDRARYSAARRQGERKGYERAFKEIDARIAGAGLIDPITNQPITSLKEYEDYGRRYRQQRLETKAREQKKTLAQVEDEEAAMELLARKRREDGEREEAARKQKAQLEWLQQDLMDFEEAFPGVDIAKLEADPKFMKFCGKRWGKVPAAELYTDYLDVVGKAQIDAAASQQSKRERSTGAGVGAGADVLSPQQRQELEEWNNAFPDMKMTEKEFRKWAQK